MTSTALPRPPGRAVLRLAGIFTQLVCAICLLLGTIAFVLIQQNKSAGAGLAIAWGAIAMVGIVLGGLMGRGGLIAVIGSALLDITFGIVLVVLDVDDLRYLVRILRVDDVVMIGTVLTGVGGAMSAIGVVCLTSIPQAVRYSKWLREGDTEYRPPRTTARGWAAPSASKGSMWHMPAAPEENRSRRRLYFALAGFAIGIGAGVGVLVSSSTRHGAAVHDEPQPDPTPTKPPNTGSSAPATSPRTPRNGSAGSSVAVAPPSDAGTRPQAATPESGAKAAAGSPGPGPIDALLGAQRAAIARGDIAALATLLAPHAFAFGVDAEELVEGRDAIVAQLQHDLGEGTGSITSKSLHVGELDGHAWIAEELEVGIAKRRPRRYAVTQLAAVIDGKWQIVAWCWSMPVADTTADRLAVLGTKPQPKSLPNVVEGPPELANAVRTAFGSRREFVASRSERDDAFNVGSGPNERVAGGARIKDVFNRRFRGQLRVHDNVRVVAGSAWDPKQKTAPWIGFAALNVDVTFRTRAATQLTQTFRVLAIALKEGNDWHLVQTQWSHGGPLR